MADQEEKHPERDPLNIEYQECVTHSRFLVGTRFSYFVSFTTLFFVLIGGFYYIWSEEEKVGETLKPWLLFTISSFGLYVISTILILEQRVIQLYKYADNRAAELERLMGIQNGIRQIFIAPQRVQYFFRIPLTHTFGIGMFYKVIFAIWVAAVLFSIFQIFLSFIR